MVRENGVFRFRVFEPAEVWNEVNRLDTTKTTSGDLPAHILKITSDLSFSAVTQLANEIAQQCKFPNKFKLADVSQVFKSGDTTEEKNFRPISVRSSLSKVLERLLLKQFLLFIEETLVDPLCF